MHCIADRRNWNTWSTNCPKENRVPLWQLTTTTLFSISFNFRKALNLIPFKQDTIRILISQLLWFLFIHWIKFNYLKIISEFSQNFIILIANQTNLIFLKEIYFFGSIHTTLCLIDPTTWFGFPSFICHAYVKFHRLLGVFGWHKFVSFNLIVFFRFSFSFIFFLNYFEFSGTVTDHFCSDVQSSW